MILVTSVAPGVIFLSGLLVDTTHGWEKVGNGAAVLVCVVLGVRTGMLGIFAGPEQIVVRDYFRTYRIRWADIAGFAPPPPYGTWRKAGLRIHLVDGRLVSATLYGHNQVDSSRTAGRVVQELERLRLQNAGDRMAVSPPGDVSREPGASA